MLTCRASAQTSCLPGWLTPDDPDHGPILLQSQMPFVSVTDEAAWVPGCYPCGIRLFTESRKLSSAVWEAVCYLSKEILTGFLSSSASVVPKPPASMLPLVTCSLWPQTGHVPLTQPGRTAPGLRLTVKHYSAANCAQPFIIQHTF